jgi:hypothetical protein
LEIIHEFNLKFTNNFKNAPLGFFQFQYLISEGNEKLTDKDSIKFFSIAKGSAVFTHLEKKISLWTLTNSSISNGA